jgi:coenzyme PQQ precursor peptide PqqA
MPERWKAASALHAGSALWGKACHVSDPACEGAGNAGAGTPIWTNGGDMSWHKPKFIEVSCAMEITRYAPADGDEPILF